MANEVALNPICHAENGLVSAEAVTWAFRLFLGREPRDDAEVAFHRRHPSFESLRRGFARTNEFSAYHQRLRPREGYRAPLWLLRPPADGRLAAPPGPPSIARPVSQLCTQEQMEDPLFLELMREIGVGTVQLHRKHWEFGYILAVLRAAGLLRPGVRALGFGVGQEPLPALFARHGIDVMATDAPPELDRNQGWASTGQHSTSLEGLQRPRIVDAATLRRHVSFRPVDMNRIPEDLRDFDFCWSACCFEHLGSIGHGLDFFENSLRCLRPGGIAVHTTEFNLSSNDDTLESPATSIFRRRDIEALLTRLLEAGHQVWPLNLHPGDRELDEHVDLPPFSMPHLKLQLSRYTCTSIGLVAVRGG